MNDSLKKIAIPTGDANGIGAEITIKALNKLKLPKESVVLVSNKNVLETYGKLNIDYPIVEIPYEKKYLTPGNNSKQSGEFGYLALESACKMARDEKIQGIVTAPLSKNGMHLAGYEFNGQTEVLQKLLAQKGQCAEMLFVSGTFRVLLLTRHVALKEICIDKDKIISQISCLEIFFKERLKIKSPKFALCGFNPHAGENGILGKEEQDILIPAVEELSKLHIDITKPLPADTLFIDAARAYLKGEDPPFDCYIATYHDQGLTPIKTVAARKTVNMTIGLDVVRTSPCHGTAFDIAGQNIANEDSMIEAILQVQKYI